MWIITTIGAFSAVEDWNDRKRLLLRARVKSDLEELKRLYLPKMGKIRHTPKADYAYRASVTKEDLSKVMGKMIMDINYPNFKNAVRERQGWARVHVYHDVWADLRELQYTRGIGKRQESLPLWPDGLPEDWALPNNETLSDIEDIPDMYWDDDLGCWCEVERA